MRALRYSHQTGEFKLEDVPKPVPEGDDVLIQVKATALTNGELTWSETKAQEPAIPGHDVAGVIDSIGHKVTGFHPGDEVIALLPFARPGAASSYTLAPSSDLALKPSSLTFPEAAALPLSALTAYQALFTHADAQPGQKLLVAGAGGGVGAIVVQMAVAARMVVTGVCSAGKADLVRGLGAHSVIDREQTTLSSLSHDYDVVIDTIGSTTLPQLFPLLKGKGQLICIARPATEDEKAQRPDVRAMFFIVEPDGEELTRIVQCVEQEVLRPMVGKVMPLEAGAEAFDVVGKGGVGGKVVLEVEGRVDSPRLTM